MTTENKFKGFYINEDKFNEMLSLNYVCKENEPLQKLVRGRMDDQAMQIILPLLIITIIIGVWGVLRG